MMHLERLLKRGSLKNESKTLLRRLKHNIEGFRPYFGGVELVDLAFSFPIALIYCICFISIFVYLATTTFLNTIQTKVVSLKNIKDRFMSCEPISKPLGGYYTGDLDGYWEREDDYTADLSIFTLATYGKALTKEDYKIAMEYFKNEASNFARLAAKRTMAWNIAVLSASGYKHPDTGLGFWFTVDAMYIYDVLVKVATISNQNGTCTGSNTEYLSGSFKVEQSSLTLQMPFRVNASSVNGGFIGPSKTRKAASSFSITFTPAVQEPCPLHGNWFSNVFFGAEAEYRDGYAEIGFDVRSAMVAISMNIGRMGPDTLVSKQTALTQALGLIALVDPFYTFPYFQRIYCVNKSAPIWSDYKFSKDEKLEQDRQFNATYGIKSPIYRPQEYPNICFLTPKTKSGLIKFYYPMISMLKWDKDECFNRQPRNASKTSDCPVGTVFPSSPIMTGCKCPRDKSDVDCNRHSIFTSFFYDTNIPMSIFRGTSWVDATKRIVRDNAIKLGIAVQKKMIEWKKDAKIGNEYDVKAMELFDDVVASTVNEFNNMAAVDIEFDAPQPDSSNAKTTPRSSLRRAWNKLLAVIKETGFKITPGPLAPVSAIVFRSVAAYGYGNTILPMNQFDLQLDDLTSRDPRSIKYYEVYANLMLPASACANPYNFDAAFARIIEHPPTNLTESFYSCTRKPESFWVVALGSAYSSANAILNLLWAALGALMVWGWKRYLRRKNSPETIVSHRAKKRLEGLLQELKDDSLAGVVTDLLESQDVLLARIAALEKQSRQSSIVSMHDNESNSDDKELRRRVFTRLYNSKSSVEDDTLVAQQLGEREREDTLKQMDKFKSSVRRHSMVAGTSRSGARAEAQTEAEAYAETRTDAEADGEVEMRSLQSAKPNHFSSAHRLHQAHQQHQQHQQQRNFDDQGEEEPIEHFTHNPQHQLQQHTRKHQPHALDEEVAAAARRMSQRILSPSGPVPDMGVAALAARKARAAVAAAESGPSPPPKRLSTLPISASLSGIQPTSNSRVHK